LISLESSAGTHEERLLGISVLAGVSLLLAVAYAALAALTYRGTLPLASGAWLLGSGLETYGPLVFLIFAALHLRLSFDLWRRKRWGRILGLILAGLGIYLVVPSISSAVVDARLGAIARDGAQIVARVLVIWYLMQREVKEAFGG
jgi:hypothetical protein